MKKLFILLFPCIFFINGCTHSKSIQEKFNTFKDKDYSEFRDMSIIYSKGVYFVTYHDSTYKIKRNFFTKRLSSIEMFSNKDADVMLGKKDKEYIEHALDSFDKMKLMTLYIDKNGNVFISVPWYDRCTYFFLRLSSLSTLESLKKQYYQNYKGSWYMNKECSER